MPTSAASWPSTSRRGVLDLAEDGFVGPDNPFKRLLIDHLPIQKLQFDAGIPRAMCDCPRTMQFRCIAHSGRNRWDDERLEVEIWPAGKAVQHKGEYN